MAPVAFATQAGTAYGLSVGGISAGMTATGAAVSSAIGAALYSAYGQYQAGKVAAQAHGYSAELAEQEAETIKEASEYEERESRTEGRRLKARQLLQFAKGGVVPTTGTPLTVRGRTAEEIEKDIQLQRYGYGIQYGKKISEAKLERMKGKAATRAGRWGAGTSLMTGAYRVASIYR